MTPVSNAQKIFDSSYEFATLVDHAGTLIALACDANNQIRYRIMYVADDPTLTKPAWGAIQKLEIPDETYPSSMSLLNLANTDTHISVPNTPTQFQVISFGNFIYIFRQASDGTLLVDQYGLAADANAGASLAIAHQVRYQRSQSADLPESLADTFGDTNLDHQPFKQPTRQILLKVAEQGRLRDAPGPFSASVVPASMGEQTCILCVYNSKNTNFVTYNFPTNEYGELALETISLSRNERSSDFFILNPPRYFLSLEQTPAATTYAYQESVTNAEGDVSLKRSTHLMMAFWLTDPNQNAYIGVLDFPLGADGTLPYPTSGNSYVLPWLSDDGSLSVVDEIAPGVAITGALLQFETSNPNLIPASAPSFLDSADGLVHLYFQNKNGTLSGLQYNPMTAKARYQTDLTFPQNTQLCLEAPRVGSYYNNLNIQIKDNAQLKQLADLSITDSKGKNSETWQGLPRDLPTVEAILAGKSDSDPTNDNHFVDGRKTFFDAAKQRLQYCFPVQNTDESGLHLVARGLAKDLDTKQSLAHINQEVDGSLSASLKVVANTDQVNRQLATFTANDTNRPANLALILSIEKASIYIVNQNKATQPAGFISSDDQLTPLPDLDTNTVSHATVLSDQSIWLSNPGTNALFYCTVNSDTHFPNYNDWQSHKFRDGINLCGGIAPWQSGVIVGSQSPEAPISGSTDTFQTQVIAVLNQQDQVINIAGFSQDPGMVLDIVVDPVDPNTFWLATSQGGIVKVKIDPTSYAATPTFFNTANTDQLTSNAIAQLAIDSNKYLWVADLYTSNSANSQTQLAFCNTQTNDWHQIDAYNVMLQPRFVTTSDTYIYASDRLGNIVAIQAGTSTVNTLILATDWQNQFEVPQGETLRLLQCDADGTLYAKFAHQGINLNTQATQALIFSKQRSNDDFSATPISGLRDNHIDVLHTNVHENQLTLYIGNHKPGLDCYTAGANQPWQSVFVPNVSNQSITAITSDPTRGMIYAGTRHGTLICQDLQTGDIYNYDQNNSDGTLNSKKIMSLLVHPQNGDLYLGGVGVLAKIEQPYSNLVSWTPIDLNLSHEDYSALAWGNDNLWVGTLGSGLIQLDDNLQPVNTYKKSSTHHALPSNLINCLIYDPKNRLWIGTDKGLACKAGVHWDTYTHRNSQLTADKINDLCFQTSADSNLGQLWIANDGGLNSLATHGIYKLWQSYSKSNHVAFPSNAITALAAGTDGTLWLGTHKGLTHFDPHGLASLEIWRDLPPQAQAMRNILGGRDPQYNYAANTLSLPYPRSLATGSQNYICPQSPISQAQTLTGQAIRIQQSGAVGGSQYLRLAPQASTSLRGQLPTTSDFTQSETGYLPSWVIENPNRSAYHPSEGAQLLGGPSDSLNLQQDLTLEAWIRPGSFNKHDPYARLINYKASSDQDSKSYTLGLRPSNYSLNFDGHTNYLLLDDWNLGNTFTIQFWASLGTSQATQTFIGKHTKDGHNQFVLIWEKESFAIMIGGTPYYFDSFSISKNTAFQLTLVAQVVDHNPQVTLHITQGTSTISSQTIPVSQWDLSNGLPWIVGVDRDLEDEGKPAWDEWFQGSLDELRIWDRALTHSSDHAIDHWISGKEDGLVAYYRLNEGPGAHKLLDMSGNGFDVPITTSFTWGDSLLPQETQYALFAAAQNDDIAFNAANSPLQTYAWQHVAAVYRGKPTIQFNGNTYIDAGNANNLNVRDELSIETWIQPRDKNTPMVGTLLSKYGQLQRNRSYRLHINTDGYLTFIVYRSVSARGNYKRPLRVQSAKPLHQYATNDRGWYYIAATLEMDDVRRKAHNKIVHDIDWDLQLYVNGRQVGTKQSDAAYKKDIIVQQTTTPLLIGASNDHGQTEKHFVGNMLNMRLWARELDDNEILNAFISHTRPNDTKGLVADWAFSEGQGKMVADNYNQNHASLSNSDSWGLTSFQSIWQLYLNGEPVQAAGSFDLRAVGNYGSDNQISIGSINTSVTDTQILRGHIDEVRIWNTAKSQLHINATRFNPVTEQQPGLCAYYNFNDHDDDTSVVDVSGNHNNLNVSPASAKIKLTSTYVPPLDNEGPLVTNPVFQNDIMSDLSINQTPCAAEQTFLLSQPDSQTAGYVRRVYLYSPATTNSDEAGIYADSRYLTGELIRVYLGQTQIDPTIIGVIEGAPPVPSENLTINDPVTDDYVGASSVKLARSRDTQYSYSVGRDDGVDASLDFKIGAFAKVSTGIDATISDKGIKEKVYAEGSVALHLKAEGSIGWLRSAGRREQLTQNSDDTLVMAGAWEQPQDYDHNQQPRYLNADIGQRYVPNNMGYALVNSQVADLYGLVLKRNRTLLSYQSEVRHDIKAQKNIIMFPLNPKYLRGGSLDGNVGFVQDPACSGQPSYFRPAEANEFDKQIAKERARIKSKYDQFGVFAKLFDWTPKDSVPDSKISKKHEAVLSMKNSYIWTADGGLYDESQEEATAFEESHGKSGAIKLLMGFELKIKSGNFASYNFSENTSIDGGLFLEGDLLLGGHFSATSSKTKQASEGFKLLIDAPGEGFLNRKSLEGQYSAEPQPGKVSSYRFNSYYLKPSKTYFDTLFHQVIDPQWLEYSNHPSAVALRQARNRRNKLWRVTYRVTYVERILPEEGTSYPNNPKHNSHSAPEMSGRSLRTASSQAHPQISPLNIPAPTNINANLFIIWLVENLTNPKVDPKHPTTTSILSAIEYLLQKELAYQLSWWQAYWEQNSATQQGQQLKANITRYLLSYYGLISES